MEEVEVAWDTYQSGYDADKWICYGTIQPCCVGVYPDALAESSAWEDSWPCTVVFRRLQKPDLPMNTTVPIIRTPFEPRCAVGPAIARNQDLQVEFSASNQKQHQVTI